MPGNFFDTNVLVYLAGDGRKADRAEAAVSGGGAVSVQVLNELANVARRKIGAVVAGYPFPSVSAAKHA